ncbi:Cholesterol 7-desaturase [Gryllus bimaculatus]|nr:Cholesterol 7-desaturase [Gryllus bimaculatus]
MAEARMRVVRGGGGGGDVQARAGTVTWRAGRGSACARARAPRASAVPRRLAPSPPERARIPAPGDCRRCPELTCFPCTLPRFNAVDVGMVCTAPSVGGFLLLVLSLVQQHNIDLAVLIAECRWKALLKNTTRRDKRERLRTAQRAAREAGALRAIWRRRNAAQSVRRSVRSSRSVSGGSVSVDAVTAHAAAVAAAAAAQLPNLAPVDALGWVQALLAAAALFLVYRYLIRPLDYRRDLSDVGFGHVGGVAGAGVRHRRADVVRDVRRRRRVGALPPVYPNGWFALLESGALPAGEVRHVAALGENWAVLRTADGQAHVLDAYCPHLGANMAVGGAVRGDCLECPFHGWRFDARDGRCAAVPYADKVPEFARVKRWESCEANGFVFVWYHAEGEPPSWQVEGVPQVGCGEWLFRGRSEFLINSHIQVRSPPSLGLPLRCADRIDGRCGGGGGRRRAAADLG